MKASRYHLVETRFHAPLPPFLLLFFLLFPLLFPMLLRVAKQEKIKKARKEIVVHFFG